MRLWHQDCRLGPTTRLKTATGLRRRPTTADCILRPARGLLRQMGELFDCILQSPGRDRAIAGRWHQECEEGACCDYCGRLLGACVALAAATAAAQAQAANGNIEGTVRDTTGAALPGVTVTVTNIDTGTARTSVTNDDGGLPRARCCRSAATRSSPSCRASRPSSSRASRCRPARPRSINVQLERRHVVRDDHRHQRVADRAARQDRPRTDDRRDRDQEPAARLAQPLQLRVPAGQRHRLREQRVRRAAHQRQRHADAHQLPARRQHQHREGPRRPAPAAGLGSAGPRGEGHHQRLRAGVRPDDRHGLQRDHAVGHQRPPRLGQLPLPAQRDVVAAVLPRRRPRASPTPRPTTSPRTLGGPIVKDKLHFYGAYEYVDRSLVTGGQVITVDPAGGAALGITLPASGVIPAHQKVNFVFGKTDYQLNAANRLSARYFLFKNFSLVEHRRRPDDARSRDRLHRSHGFGVGAAGVDASAATKLNELRVQYARRHQFRTPADTAVDGPAITVSGVANFGGPRIGDTNSVGFDFNQGIWQVIDNLTWMRGKHSFKAGIDAQFIADDRGQRRALPLHLPEHRRLPGGQERRRPARLHLAAAGLRQSRRSTTTRRFYGLFVQDDWQVSAADEAAVRPALRRVRRAVGAQRSRPTRYSQRLHDRQEQLRAARRVSRGRSTIGRRPCCARRSA